MSNKPVAQPGLSTDGEQTQRVVHELSSQWGSLSSLPQAFPEMAYFSNKYTRGPSGTIPPAPSMHHVQLPAVGADLQQQLAPGRSTVGDTGSRHSASFSAPSLPTATLLSSSNALGLYLPIHPSLTEFPLLWDVRGSRGTCPTLPSTLLDELAFPYHLQQVEEAVVWLLPRYAERKRTDFDAHSVIFPINATTTVSSVLQDVIDALWKGYSQSALSGNSRWLLGDATIARQRRGAISSSGGRAYWRHIDLYPPSVLYFRGVRPLGRVGRKEHFLVELHPVHPTPR
ncbi:hypothetical protein C8Q79DRAFT_309101 [Trametes meyenii]|nr:hypothetical protein C8Q79DRAFT_309101 [Trametes meyenii]